jgi:hypothetical protein
LVSISKNKVKRQRKQEAVNRERRTAKTEKQNSKAPRKSKTTKVSIHRYPVASCAGHKKTEATQRQEIQRHRAGGVTIKVTPAFQTV